MSQPATSSAAPSPQKVVIDQRDNFAGRFGMVLRSSAIFYFRQSEVFRTTISVLNYWKLKRDVQVLLVASLRSLDGTLVGREPLRFDVADVINYVPALSGDFEGSVEIEVFATQNMVIPYAAIIAYYDTPRGHTMVHSYARAYSRYEVEDGRILSKGEEGCWTLRDTAERRSFGVFHNGPGVVPPQDVTLRVQRANHAEGALVKTFTLPELRPYQTVRIVPAEHFPELATLLAGGTGFAQLSFQLGESFTRMLVGHESTDGRDCQVTHSNFNYRVHQTNLLPETIDRCFMYVPSMGRDGKSLVIYPDANEGEYVASWDGQAKTFRSGDGFEAPIEGGMVEVRRNDGPMPSRVVAAIAFAGAQGALPAEISLGVVSVEQPPKRLWWGPIQWNDARKSRLVLHDLPAVYGAPAEGATVAISLYGAQPGAPLKTTLPLSELPAFERGIPLDTLFPDAATKLGGQPGYYTAFSEYPGLTAYTVTESATGSCTVEHGF